MAAVDESFVDQPPPLSPCSGAGYRDAMDAAQRRIGPIIALSLAILALWLLSRPYVGIIQDARLYIGQALAVLSPDTIGRDLMFVRDGQFGFTLFSAVTLPLVRMLGAEHASMLLALLGLLAFIAATAFLAGKIARGRLFWVMLIFVAIGPAEYGGLDTISFAQPYATPRPFACAAVLAALGLGISGRFLAAIALLVVGSLLHPIMAVPGFAVIAILFLAEHRQHPKVLGVCAATIAFAFLTLVAAAWLDLPIAGRLFTRIDPEWRDILEDRNTYLFATLWNAQDWSRVFVQSASLVLTAMFASGRLRVLLYATAAVGPIGVVASMVFGDLLGSLLVMQVQLWRATWVTGSVALLVLPLCWTALWPRGGLAHAALALLLAAWIITSLSAIAAPLAAVALAAGAAARYRSETSPGFLVQAAAWSTLGLAATALGVLYAYAAVLDIASAPDRAAWGLSTRLILFAGYLPLCALALASLQARSATWPPFAAPIIAVAALAVMPIWDQRSDWQRLVDQGHPAPGLAALLEGQSEILWLDERRLSTAVGFAGWRLADSPNWVSGMQGASIVFSRPQALFWRMRVERLLDAGLVKPVERQIGWESAVARAPVLEPSDITRFCSADDAPTRIIVPADKAIKVIEDDSARIAGIWKSPTAAYSRIAEADATWQETRDFAVLRCGVRRPAAS